MTNDQFPMTNEGRSTNSEYRLAHSSFGLRPSLVIGHLALVVLVLLPAPAQAHEVIIQCELKGNQVLVKAVFSDGKPARDAKVRIVDGKEVLAAEGVTDAQGQWSLPRPAPGRYHIEVNAGAGHLKKDAFTIPPDAAAGDSPVKINESPSYEETSRAFWPKLAVGLGAIAGFFLALWLAKRRRMVR